MTRLNQWEKVIWSSIFGIVVLVLLIPDIHALSLTGELLSPIIYEKGKVIRNHYLIEGTDRETNVSLSGDLLEYISIENLNHDSFDLVIQFPQVYITPGIYWFGLTVRELPVAEEGMSSLVSVSRKFKVEVYSDEKAVDVSLSAQDVNQGTIVPLTMTVTSRGYKDINQIWGEISILDQTGKQIGWVKTPTKPLPALAAETITAEFNTSTIPAAEYRAFGILHYDDKDKKANTTFRVGNVDLILLNYTSVVEPGFNTFTMQIMNNWGNELNDVFGKVFVHDAELLHTPSIDLEPWQKGILQGIIKIELEPGVYNGSINLFFEGEQKEVPIQLSVLAPLLPLVGQATAQPSSFPYGWVIGLGAVIILLIIVIIILTRKNKSNNHEL